MPGHTIGKILRPGRWSGSGGARVSFLGHGFTRTFTPAVVIAGAGGAAHLAGVIAAHTILPVIGVPIPSTSLNGMDSLLSTVQMPAGIPVATVAIGKPGASNAGILAAQMIGLADEEIVRKLRAHKEKLARGVEEKSKKLKSS